MNYLKSRFISLLLPTLFLVGAAASKATTIGGPGSTCATCDGAAYTLTYSGSPISSTATTQTFEFTLNIDDTYYNGGGSFLNSVAIKVTSAGHLVGGSLVSAPSGFTLSAGNGLNANGCSGANDGYVCAQGSGNGVSVLGGPYNFVYDVTIDSGNLFTGVNASMVKALYVDSNGKKAGDVMSEDITLTTATATPEPSTVLTAGLGLVGFALISARLRKRSAKPSSL